MGIFNEKQKIALRTGIYICDKCGSEMELIDEWTLYCNNCGYEIDPEYYGFESMEEYEKLYPNIADMIELEKLKNGEIEPDDDDGEYYEEENGELTNRLED